MPKRVESGRVATKDPVKCLILKRNLYLNVAKKTDVGVNTVSHTKLLLNAVVFFLHPGIRYLLNG